MTDYLLGGPKRHALIVFLCDILVHVCLFFKCHCFDLCVGSYLFLYFVFFYGSYSLLSVMNAQSMYA